MVELFQAKDLEKSLLFQGKPWNTFDKKQFDEWIYTIFEAGYLSGLSNNKIKILYLQRKN